ncbi:hypothetical protein ACFL3D_02205, partial [Candidatus Omnitrophota bacterium]
MSRFLYTLLTQKFSQQTVSFCILFFFFTNAIAINPQNVYADYLPSQHDTLGTLLDKGDFELRDKEAIYRDERKQREHEIREMLDKITREMKRWRVIDFYDFVVVTLGLRFNRFVRWLYEIRLMKKRERDNGLPEIVVITDYHGAIELFLQYLADAISLKKYGKEGKVKLEDKNFPRDSINDQLLRQGIDIQELGLTFYLLGDLLDRGKYGVKCFHAAKELVNLGVAKYVTGNHDFWAFLNLEGFHLPVYSGYNFYGHEKSERLVKDHWNDEEISLHQNGRLGWWTEKLAEYNESQQVFQQDNLPIERDGDIEEEYIPELRKRLKSTYLNIKNELNEEQRKLWEDLIGLYFGSTDVYTGFNGIGMMSVGWWEDRLEKVEKIVSSVRGSGARPVELGVWDELADCTRAATKIVKDRLEKAMNDRKPMWWWQVFNDINHQNYSSVEWWAKDWSSHKGWGTSVIEELNERSESKWDQKNYIWHEDLQALKRFYRQNFTLYMRDPYGNMYTHAWLPVDMQTGTIRFTYAGSEKRGVVYEDGYIWDGLETIQNDVRDTHKTFPEIHEALNLVNSWYADKTTKIKPEHIAQYVTDPNLGLKKIFQKIGIRCWIMGHNPINKLHPKGVGFIVDQDGYVLVTADKGMSWQKFKDLGGYVTVSSDGIRLRGYRGLNFRKIVDNPPTIQLNKEDASKITIERKVAQFFKERHLVLLNNLQIPKLIDAIVNFVIKFFYFVMRKEREKKKDIYIITTTWENRPLDRM